MRTIIRAGLVTSAVAVLVMIAGIDPALEGLAFASSMALLGVGMGLLASQLGNVVQSSVDASGRSEAGGLQYTSQQLGSSLGVALIGAIVIAGLTSSFLTNGRGGPAHQRGGRPAGRRRHGRQHRLRLLGPGRRGGRSPRAWTRQEGAAIVEDYEAAQLQALKTGLLAAAAIALFGLMFTQGLPGRRPEPMGQPSGAVAST